MAGVAIVTGASRGIGLATARRFAAAGATVVAVARARENLAAAVADLPAAVAVAADVGDEADVERVVAAAAAAGPVVALVNNAATNELALAERLAPARFDEIVRTNLRGPFLLAQALVPQLAAAGGGAIVNVASVAGLLGPAYATAYGATKAALVNLTQGLAAELAVAGIRVNAVSPGMTDTEMGRYVLGEYEQIFGLDGDRVLAQLQGRWATPEEVAEVVYWLASPAASAVSGAHVVCDLGQTTRLV